MSWLPYITECLPGSSPQESLGIHLFIHTHTHTHTHKHLLYYEPVIYCAKGILKMNKEDMALPSLELVIREGMDN